MAQQLPLLVFKVWGLTYPTYLRPVTTLQKQILRIMTSSEPASHSEPLLKSLNSFVYQWFHQITPSCFSDYFKPISSLHSYNTHQSLNEHLFINSVQSRYQSPEFITSWYMYHSFLTISSKCLFRRPKLYKSILAF